MKVFYLEKPRVAKYADIPVRPLLADEILVKVAYAGICGTDISFFTGESDFVRQGLVNYPIRIGHEWSGIVSETGTAVTRFKSGDHVIGDNGVTCGICPSCRKGDYASCPNGMSVGTINCWDGCFADYIIMPERHLYHLPKNVSLEEAAMIEPATIPLGALAESDITGKTVAVIGTGPIGMTGLVLARHYGAGKIVMIGRTPEKLAIARKMGADFVIQSTTEDTLARINEITGGKGAEIVLEASGAISAILQSADIVARRGFIYLLAFYEKELRGLEIDKFIFKEAHLSGVMGDYGRPEIIAGAMAGGGISFMPMVTHRIGFDDLKETFENWDAIKDRVKVLVRL